MSEKILVDQSMQGLEDGIPRVYKENAPTIASRIYKEPHLIIDVESGGDRQICAMRGRNPDNPTSREKCENLEQRLEIRPDGMSNCITSVDKDNYVLEQNAVRIGTDEPTEKPKTIKVRQATKEGFIEVEIPGVVDLNYPTSNTRRGRVIRGGQICPTLTTESIPSVVEMAEDSEFWNFLYEIDGEIYLIRVRKLIPLETWRLMGFTDDDFHKAEAVNSSTQLYKQAGNSIVKMVLMAIFRQMGIGKEN